MTLVASDKAALYRLEWFFPKTLVGGPLSEWVFKLPRREPGAHRSGQAGLWSLMYQNGVLFKLLVLRPRLGNGQLQQGSVSSHMRGKFRCLFLILSSMPIPLESTALYMQCLRTGYTPNSRALLANPKAASHKSRSHMHLGLACPCYVDNIAILTLRLNPRLDTFAGYSYIS